jgi:hypothetical protein
MSALRGEGLLALWGSVDPAQEDGFNDWYTHEHLPERIALPGFLRARRYVADVGRVGERSPGRYFTIYETTSVAALSSAEYLHALDHPTPATSRYMPLFAAMSRTGCRVLSSRSLGVGGSLDVFDVVPRRGTEEELRSWIIEEHAPGLLTRPGVLGVHLAAADSDATSVRDRTTVYRDLAPGSGDWLLLVEGAWTDHVSHERDLDRDADAVSAHGADVRSCGSYRLLAQLDDRDPAPPPQVRGGA